MSMYGLLSIIVTLAVLIAFINYHYIKQQPSIAIMSGSLILSLTLLLLNAFGLPLSATLITSIKTFDFQNFLMKGLLSFLLFAGALTIDISQLRRYKVEIGVLASLSTIFSTLAIGCVIYYLLPFFGIPLPFLYCLLFGALISPTDPIAVLAMCKSIKAPSSLTTTIAGESLFNDGVGIVLFVSILSLISQESTLSIASVSSLFAREALGGILYGFILAKIIKKLMQSVLEINLLILLTLAVTTGGYGLANLLDVSGPLAMVVAGIILGNQDKLVNENQVKLQTQLKHFWELIDEILNAILFLFLGFELLVIELSPQFILISLASIPVVLLVRFLTVATPIKLFSKRKNYPTHFIKIMTWGGLRGGLAVALALALPPSGHRPIILAMTYTVVIFSILIQGMTVKSLVAKSRSTI